MLDKEFCRNMTHNSLCKELSIIEECYMKIYDEYYTTGSRDSTFLKDLVDSIKGISAILEVYTRDGEIHPEYAIEKLKFSKSYINSTIEYFENKKKMGGKDEHNK